MLLGHIVRVGGDHRPIEHSLALPPSLFHEDLHLSGAIVDATFAVRKPPLLEQLRSRDLPYVVDPEALRFGSDAYQDVDRLAALPYAPAAPITSSTTDDDIHRFVVGSLMLQAQVGATAYIAPCLPLDNNGDALKLNRRLAHAARDALGVEVDRRPLIVSVAPATRVLAEFHHQIAGLNCVVGRTPGWAPPPEPTGGSINGRQCSRAVSAFRRPSVRCQDPWTGPRG